ncbi:hypothetical protein [Shewanella frigidimarina]|uniref:Uncharacterized protein n=2 Tax=Shewanella frigidimarina TaxID=56812 RepID=Q083U4_SHEFN|nr:hypothetical protein [Shewanella frigidimarina]ABI71471.1 hypothetical protein Sfri_1620 [Shewanella frigidimarina NCIMB 400]KVX02621.1 hypothetical protein AWJ07_13000 [Shewanella frigidimarina]
MNIIKLVILSLCISIGYYALSIVAIGQSAAGNLLWRLNSSEFPLLSHLAQNFIGIGLAALIPAFLVKSYEAARQWIAITIVILGAMLLHGNIHYMPWDPMGIVRFVNNTLFYGDIGAKVLFFYILLLPVLWLLLLKRMARI